MEAASLSEAFEAICKSTWRHKQEDCSFTTPFLYDYVFILYRQIWLFRPLKVIKNQSLTVPHRLRKIQIESDDTGAP